MPKLALEIVVDAPPETVWEVLSDFAGYEQWNPLHTVDGQPARGSAVQIHSKALGGRVLSSIGLVWKFEPNAKLEFLSGNPLWYTLKRFFHISAYDGGALLKHGVAISGVWVLWLFSTRGHKIERLKPMFEAFASVLIHRITSRPHGSPSLSNRHARRAAKAKPSGC